jgi:hypothetical protein
MNTRGCFDSGRDAPGYFYALRIKPIDSARTLGLLALTPGHSPTPGREELDTLLTVLQRDGVSE